MRRGMGCCSGSVLIYFSCVVTNRLIILPLCNTRMSVKMLSLSADRQRIGNLKTYKPVLSRIAL